MGSLENLLPDSQVLDTDMDYKLDGDVNEPVSKRLIP